ncbi:hypothetical protein Goshw_023042 [Gossypium schwendimanii]|uniref:Uncharacterized protein n=1 Tax=Gossypium schwendimanii TaxID=34291 RepID=A0A7J9MZ40_GOSSC|nr:hypothetical protein [Gossypium schwendimanii]
MSSDIKKKQKINNQRKREYLEKFMEMGLEPPPDMAQVFKDCIEDLGGSEIKLVIQKFLQVTNLKPQQNPFDSIISTQISNNQRKLFLEMAMEANTVFKVMNQEFVKLDRFDGLNFNCWKDKMLFLLTVLNVAYVLDPNLQPVEDPSPNANSEEIAKVTELKKKRKEDNFTCQ